VTLPAIFNVGWASVQISTMAVVNSITHSTARRDRLISLRNGFTFVANFVVLTMALVIFALITDQVLQFRILAILILAIGGVSSLFYIFVIREVRLTNEATRIQKEYN
jgi:Na+/melibiose symporter-like transporter